MAAVKLCAVFLNAADNPADRIALDRVADFSRDPKSLGEVRRGAGGRTRSFMRAGRSVSWSLAFQSVTPDQKRWLEDHMGQLVCVRDDRGGKIFATYLDLSFSENLYNHKADTALALTELSYSEEV